MFQLTATPASALVDEPVHIRVTGLPPLQLVTLTASLKDEKGNVFLSKAFYKANEVGELDLMEAPAFGGDYVGVHPMGLFWSLKCQKAFRRLLKQDVMNSPFWVTLNLYDTVGFQDFSTEEPMASQVVQRWFSAPGVQRVQVREGRVRGALFLPPGEGPFPGVIDLFGGRGGLVEFRASLLAAHGFAVLALAYFAYEDLPELLQEIDLEYFEEAANLLLAHPKVQTPGIGVISVSKGAEIGLAMACFLKQVVATICINGTTAIYDFPLRYKDLVIAPIPIFMERLQFDISGAIRLLHFRGDPRDELNQRSVLPVEKAQGSILFIVGENDECLKSREYAEQALHQLRNHGRNNGRMLVYPGAGHLIEPPYTPLCYASPNMKLSSPLLWGGDPTAHAAAQEHSWGEILKFFRQHLIQARRKL
ncbi:acyl-coenzyme A amino acid N-acyltransferase 2-like [Meles meles]|uniref:acyl-coenzyme A amino acid N-acyltransferase 2-like n=1 Tax=Meles meles TaxID=9662 RepID=UPI001E699122|nr:acyl-coenzyme A amino acid N-acyltransferase 2-like [Meles meles]XP_045878510.1 acyl-coenzyme A amino acid N-acyltransferase 2-like [Meles meles]XP_045878511.1 acyl-coenzyme A amino acid N-acyltransferase 2-like [Meles meles]